MIQGLYVITDDQISRGRSHVEIAQAALEGGAKIIQLRDKYSTDLALYKAAVELRRLTKDADAKFIVNDRVDIAYAAEADGVNLGQDDLPIDAARRVLGESAIIGISVDTPEQAVQAENAGANYIGFGPIFPTTTKADTGPVVGLAILKLVCEHVRIPVVAIGGIDVSNIASVAACGAASAAVVSAVAAADDMVKATVDLVSEFERCKN